MEEERKRVELVWAGLKHFPFFSGMHPSSHKSLLASLVLRTFNTGELVYTAGEVARNYYVLLQGWFWRDICMIFASLFVMLLVN
jgi:hypothetical protein